MHIQESNKNMIDFRLINIQKEKFELRNVV